MQTQRPTNTLAHTYFPFLSASLSFSYTHTLSLSLSFSRSCDSHDVYIDTYTDYSFDHVRPEHRAGAWVGISRLALSASRWRFPDSWSRETRKPSFQSNGFVKARDRSATRFHDERAIHGGNSPSSGNVPAYHHKQDWGTQTLAARRNIFTASAELAARDAERGQARVSHYAGMHQTCHRPGNVAGSTAWTDEARPECIHCQGVCIVPRRETRHAQPGHQVETWQWKSCNLENPPLYCLQRKSRAHSNPRGESAFTHRRTCPKTTSRPQ